MVSTQEVIERSFYANLLAVAKALGYTLDPADYQPRDAANAARFKADMEAMDKFVYIFGSGNNQSKDQKITPRIVIVPQGFYPGNIGLPKSTIEKVEGVTGFLSYDDPYETLDQYVDVHIVADNVNDERILHSIMFNALPQRGYIKPYDEDSFLWSGNIFLEVTNYYNRTNVDYGIIEKVYQYICKDIPLTERETDNDIVPIVEITAMLQIGEDGPETELIKIP